MVSFSFCLSFFGFEMYLEKVSSMLLLETRVYGSHLLHKHLHTDRRIIEKSNRFAQQKKSKLSKKKN